MHAGIKGSIVASFIVEGMRGPYAMTVGRIIVNLYSAIQPRRISPRLLHQYLSS